MLHFIPGIQHRKTQALHSQIANMVSIETYNALARSDGGVFTCSSIFNGQAEPISIESGTEGKTLRFAFRLSVEGMQFRRKNASYFNGGENKQFVVGILGKGFAVNFTKPIRVLGNQFEQSEIEFNTEVSVVSYKQFQHDFGILIDGVRQFIPGLSFNADTIWTLDPQYQNPVKYTGDIQKSTLVGFIRVFESDGKNNTQKSVIHKPTKDSDLIETPLEFDGQKPLNKAQRIAFYHRCLEQIRQTSNLIGVKISDELFSNDLEICNLFEGFTMSEIEEVFRRTILQVHNRMSQIEPTGIDQFYKTLGVKQIQTNLGNSQRIIDTKTFCEVLMQVRKRLNDEK